MNAPSNTPPVIEDANQSPMKQRCEHHAECMKIIQAILDDEATEAEKDHFRANMDTCIPCIEAFKKEKCIKDSLQLKVEKVPCPKNLLDTILKKINN